MDTGLSHKQVLCVHTELQLKKQDQGSLSKTQSTAQVSALGQPVQAGLLLPREIQFRQLTLRTPENCVTMGTRE